MNRIEQIFRQDMGRRDLLKYGLGAATAAALAKIGLKPAEAGATPEDLPAHIEYFEAGAAFTNKAGEINVPLQKKGDILLLMSQKVRVMGNTWDSDPTKKPQETQVIGIILAGDKPVTVTYQTFDGIFTRQDRERTLRLDRDSLIEDVTTAALVQVSRSRIPGNCVPTGCAATRFITAIAFDRNGNTVYEPLSNRMEIR